MLKKKLLAIAGVLGILASGACFLPPIHNGPPTPPPPPPQLKGIQTVRVFVTDNSVPAHVDTAAIATILANRIDYFSRDAGITAHAGGDAADADLTVVISNESATLKRVEPSDNSEFWSFEISMSESLKNANGEMLKQRSNLHVRSLCRLPDKHPDDVWSVPAARQQYGGDLSFIAMHGMFF